jgi:S-formylglutathione hydrolase FrmB
LFFILVTACKTIPEASFTHSAEKYEVGYPVHFTNTSIDGTSVKWEFGDGNTSDENDPSHIFENQGKYTVKLQVSNDDGSDMASEVLNIYFARGTLISTKLHSPGLEGNLLGDSPDRDVAIYLPPGYDLDESKSYPVLYFLHGITQFPSTWLGGWINVNVDFEVLMNNMLGQGTLNPMIIVIPDSHNKYEGSYYTNSSVAGDWEDFIVKDVVQYMDENYRTLASREGRGIAGHSMGGYGAIKLAMKNPGIFSAVYMLSASPLVFTMDEPGSYLLEAVNGSDPEELSWQALSYVALAVAFSPDPDAGPFYGLFPLTKDGTHIDSVWQKWLEHDPYRMIPAFRDSLLKLDFIQFDCGINDEFSYSPSVTFSEKLTEYGITHVFESYEGNHIDMLYVRVPEKLLPFFSEFFGE